jgi:hypothetical protein
MWDYSYCIEVYLPTKCHKNLPSGSKVISGGPTHARAVNLGERRCAGGDRRDAVRTSLYYIPMPKFQTTWDRIIIGSGILIRSENRSVSQRPGSVSTPSVPQTWNFNGKFNRKWQKQVSLGRNGKESNWNLKYEECMKTSFTDTLNIAVMRFYNGWSYGIKNYCI